MLSVKFILSVCAICLVLGEPGLVLMSKLSAKHCFTFGGDNLRPVDAALSSCVASSNSFLHRSLIVLLLKSYLATLLLHILSNSK
jgi:hypothetical protein